MADELRSLVAPVIAVLCRRGADFAAAEDAVQEACVELLEADVEPADLKGWLITVAWRKFLDLARSDSARRRREEAVEQAPARGAVSDVDDSVALLFLCTHPALSRSAAVALTLRAVGGLTTRQIAAAHFIPEATMGQRISRAKRSIAAVELGEPGDLATVLQVLYLIFNEGYGGDVDLAAEAIRLARQVAAGTRHPEAAGLLALMLLHDARRAARFTPAGELVALAEQDRDSWDRDQIAEGITLLQQALAQDQLGPYQAQAAIAALHADAPTAAETDWVQIVQWYDELLALSDNPIARLNRAVAVGEADGAPAGLRALAEVDASLPRHAAVKAHLREHAGEAERAAELYVRAAEQAISLPERNHLLRRAARLRSSGG